MDFSGGVSVLGMDLLNRSNYKVWKTCTESCLVEEHLWDVFNGNDTSPRVDEAENSSAYRKWKQVNAKAEFILKRTISSSLFDHIIKGKLSISEYFLKVKNLCFEISLLNPKEANSEARMRRIVIHGLKSEYILFAMSIQGWSQQPSFENFENLLLSQELLAKQLGSVFVKDEEGDALVANKRNFKEKSRDMSHSRSSAIEARAIDSMINVVGIKQEIFADNPSGDMETSIEEIKEEGPEHAISETTCASSVLYSESVYGEVLEAEVFGQPSSISRPMNYSKKFVKADGESKDQIENEIDIEVSRTKDMIFESSEDANKSIKKMIDEYDSGSHEGLETSQ
ncbi:hypothetical protein EJD97_002246 [Solanum chilense]|uniref:DUF4219 domain-containing protein n=1 Tax=Solanum chilense TaxID=4083 RepID=A0A6N2C050_SOLCI|nr:hypothetical protein EJD97_002246 [Solanum chilense]